MSENKSAKPWDILNKNNWTEKEIQQHRIAICEKCDDYLPTKQCKNCMCFMPVKTTLMDASCPLNKW